MKLAVIADDFTGGADAASFLKRQNAKVVLVTKIPHEQVDCDCLVFALKIRSIPKNKAIESVKQVCEYLKSHPVEHLYYKYCSTFDSTPKGNIGPILDFLLEYYHLNRCIICPSLPENGRTVENGILYVNGIKLAESPLKNHPLNPMWDSYIPNLMKKQSKYPCLILNRKSFDSYYDNYSDRNKHYIIPDYVNIDDAQHIVKLFHSDYLFSGGSGLLEHLFQFHNNEHVFSAKIATKTIVLCGSCSKATKSQIETWINKGKTSYAINPNSNIEELYSYIQESESEILFYSDAVFRDLTNTSRDSIFYSNAKKIESLLSKLGAFAYKIAYNRLIVAGGETSGAITSALNFTSFYIGKEIAPGVPTLIPTHQPNFHLILKSGNFGNKEFFLEALEE